MPWYAVEALDDAFDATKALLTPLDARQWLALAFVVFFLGNAGAGGTSVTAGGSSGAPADGPQVGPGGPPGQMGWEGDLPFAFGEILPIIAGVVAVALVVGLLYVLVGSVMEFVFVESLRRQRVRIRRYADQHFGQAVGLFAFRAVLGMVVALPALGLILGGVSVATGGPSVALGAVVLLVPLLVVAGLVVALVDGLTVSFVVPVMILRDVGILDGWRRFWPTLTGQWKQYAVYVLVRFGLSLVVGTVASVVGGVVGAVLFAPFAALGVVSVPALGGPEAILSNPVAVALGVALLLGYLALMTAVLAAVFVPVQTYLRYHALLVLGDTEGDLDLIPELRGDVRETR
ncbi:hypothetical protein [Halorussus sp. MSC15.2]|uniref:DUF7544 domain-containing protein n=1 Tax=Halorussus sp. MSC15.2 TaxID=2283638 RepID=UPI0013D567DB|nr:hypothetical protein [Halorussus sp. MSC15.2]NEU57052.1 hypothetical protein [Halorussus sp. MSC15.2]